MTQIKVGDHGFAVLDIAGAPTSFGIVRVGKKILLDGAYALARHVSYAYAAVGVQASGASAGVSFGTGERADAVADFLGAWPAVAAEQRIILEPASSAADLAGVADTDSRAPGSAERGPELVAASAVACVSSWRGGMAGTSCSVAGEDSTADAVRARLESEGAVVEDHGAVLFTAQPGYLDHHVAADVDAETICPIGPGVVTARGLATARKRGIAVLADFVAASGPRRCDGETLDLEAAIDLAAEAARSATEAIDRDSPHGPYLEACFAAEAFMRTWTDELPFGRPLA